MQKELKNGYVNGIIGALLGALIGAVPWYLAETFLNIFAAVLGLLISMASFYGYMLLGGARKKGFGLAVIIISSVIAVCASEYFSNFTVLCRDQYIKSQAASLGVSVPQLAFLYMSLPEVLKGMIPNLLLGLLFAALGIFSSMKRILPYFAYGTAVPEAPAEAVPQQTAETEMLTEETSDMPSPMDAPTPNQPDSDGWTTYDMKK